MLIHFINGECHIKQLRSRKAINLCLTSHTRSISHHITPLVINALGGRHTEILTRKPKQFQEGCVYLAGHLKKVNRGRLHRESSPDQLVYNAGVLTLGHHSSHQFLDIVLYLKLDPFPNPNGDWLNIHFVSGNQAHTWFKNQVLTFM